MRRPFAVSIVLLISLLGITAIAQQGPPPIGSASGASVSGTSPIVVTGSVISCPTCGTGTGNAQTANPLSQFASTTSAQLAGVLSDETGTGLAVFGTNPVLTTPNLGTPSAINLTNATGAPTWNQNTTGSAASLSVSGQSGLFTIAGLTGTNRIKTVRDAADTLLELGGSYTPTGTWTSMSLVTPAIGAATGSSLSVTGGLTAGANGGAAGALTLNGSTSGTATLTANSSGTQITDNGAFSTSTTISAGSTVSASKYLTGTNCSASGTAANPSVVTCATASSGAFACATNASGGTCQVNTTAAATNSNIQITQTDSAGTRLSVTCNTTADAPTAPRIASISNGASFTINLGTVTTNPTCYFYTITN